VTTYIRRFSELTMAERDEAGGKGASLARMFQAGFPVPDGFVVLPAAFEGDDLKQEAWEEIRIAANELRAYDAVAALAVRSSARSEDSVEASYAGEFESVLNVQTNEDLRSAISAVRASWHANTASQRYWVPGLPLSAYGRAS